MFGASRNLGSEIRWTCKNSNGSKIKTVSISLYVKMLSFTTVVSWLMNQAPFRLPGAVRTGSPGRKSQSVSNHTDCIHVWYSLWFWVRLHSPLSWRFQILHRELHDKMLNHLNCLFQRDGAAVLLWAPSESLPASSLRNRTLSPARTRDHRCLISTSQSEGNSTPPRDCRWRGAAC